MIVTIITCVFMLTTCNFIYAGTYVQIKGYPAETRSAINGSSNGLRAKRVSALLGVIFSNARLVIFSKSSSYYVKGGGLKQAREDFMTVKPTNVKNYLVTTTGKVGHKDIKLTQSDGKIFLKIREQPAGTNEEYEYIIRYYD